MSPRKPKLIPIRYRPRNKPPPKETGLFYKKVATPDKIDLEKSLSAIPVKEDLRREIVKNLGDKRITIGKIFKELEKIGARDPAFKTQLPQIATALLINDKKLMEASENYLQARLLLQQKARDK